MQKQTLALRDMLSDLTVAELHSVHLALAGELSSAPRQKEGLIEYLMSHFSQQRLERAAARLEAVEPYKHSWLFSIGPRPFTQEPAQALHSWSAKLWDKRFHSVGTLDVGSATLQPTLWLADEDAAKIYIKLTHWVYSERWHRVTPTRKELKPETIRHAVVVVMRAQQGIAEVRFNGFSQGAATSEEDRITYEKIAAEAAVLVGERIGVALLGLPLAAAIELLLETAGDEVRDVRRAVRPLGRGRIVVDAGEEMEGTDVAGYLAEFLKVSGSDKTRLESAIRQALRSTPPEHVLLHWVKDRILTRIALGDIAPEILFIWRGGGPSSNAVDAVIRKLLDCYEKVGQPRTADVLQHLASLKPGATIRVSDLAQQLQVSSDQAFASIQLAQEQGLLEPRFRVRTDKRLMDYQNIWRQSLADLPSIVVDEDGHEFSVSDPSKVELGFQRSEGRP